MLAFETSRRNYSPDVSNLHLKNAFEKNDCRIQVKFPRGLSHSLVTRICSELSAKVGVTLVSEMPFENGQISADMVWMRRPWK